MSEVLIEKMNHIEQLLLSINAKIDNFMGFEELSVEEREEVETIRGEMREGKSMSFEDVFGE